MDENKETISSPAPIYNMLQNLSPPLSEPPDISNAVNKLPLVPTPKDPLSDDVTVVTSNTSDSWTAVSADEGPSPGAEMRSAPVSMGLSANCHQALANDNNDDSNFDHRSIAVDSGAGNDFGDTSTPGTAQQLTPHGGVIIAAATGDCKQSIGTDAFALPLPKDCLKFHVFKEGDVQRPSLSVEKVCDAGCSVLFTAGNCHFFNNHDVLLQGQRDHRAGLHLLPQTSTASRLTFGSSGISSPFRSHARNSSHFCPQFDEVPAWLCQVPQHWLMDTGCQTRPLPWMARSHRHKGAEVPPKK